MIQLKPNYILQLATSRKSIRKFKNEPIEMEDIIYAINTAIQAPSGANTQPWRFIIMTNGEFKIKIRAISEE